MHMSMLIRMLNMSHICHENGNGYVSFHLFKRNNILIMLERLRTTTDTFILHIHDTYLICIMIEHAFHNNYDVDYFYLTLSFM